MTSFDRVATRGRRHALRCAALLTAAAMITTGAGCADIDAGDRPTAPAAGADRQAQVAERGAAVMPFSLEQTTHHFTKTDTGGVQTVVADNPADTAQIELVQQHLRDEAERFRGGDFTDPARIHGTAMPGLAALRDSAGRVTVDYTATTDGARITYTTSETALITALHAWFDAQVGDHGAHATQG
jgi:hypothetical protein